MQDLDDYIFDHLGVLNRFEESWRESHENDPENYPLSMNPGDWDEQFAFFKESEN